ncbi:hypothetical protein J8N05_45710 [Streptomyces sp. BH-SS-21]|uniref:Uncharacterized protein n=1 Tax=Streptomyces liliiviolaceus TaxID=2823109 RepID=A0A940Y188_9ACTN|nr:hypothetical protein [Streptomyces liliiviolaceus]MBQ0855469.1 hypothetical protein [Streptomyces liliiviolaceus]
MWKRLSSYASGQPAKRRITWAAAGLACLLALALVIALLTARSDQPPATAGASATPSGAASLSATADSAVRGGEVADPPRTSDPVAFAKAAAAMLWSYDTRTTSRSQQLAGMQAWMTGEDAYGDWTSVLAQVPDPTLWSRMADQEQRSTAAIVEGHYPAAFRQALAENPSQITKAYIYAVTVTGKVTLAWKRAEAGGTEERSLTLAVQCRPSADCSLVAIAPTVAP